MLAVTATGSNGNLIKTPANEIVKFGPLQKLFVQSYSFVDAIAIKDYATLTWLIRMIGTMI